MDHIKSSFYFKDKDFEWRVDYINHTCQVYQNGEIYHHFDHKPNTQTQNPSKSQALEIIRSATKLYKTRDGRERRLKKLLG